MSKEKRLVPELRFPEFDGEWSRALLHERMTFFNGKGHEKVVDEEGTYFLVNSKFVSTNGKIYKRTNHQICPLFKDDIVIVMSDLPNGKALGKVYYIKENNLYTLNQRIGGLRAKLDDPIFLAYQLNRNSYFLRFDDGVNQTNLRKVEINNTPLILPSLHEQKKIATFLSLIDKKIELLEKKVKLLEEQKRGLLQKIFAQEIRFRKDDGSDFEEWSLEKLGDVGEFFNGLSGLSKDNFTGGKHKFITYTNVYNNPVIKKELLENVNIGVSTQYSVEYNDLIFTQSSETIDEVGLCSVWLENMRNVYLNSFCFGLRPHNESSVLSYFLMLQLRSSSKRKLIIREGQGSTRFNLSPNRLKSIEISLPSLEEQNSIVSIFSKYDFLIDNTKEKLDNTKEMKRGLLQKIFI